MYQYIPVKQINRQLIAVLQFIFSVAAGFAFGFIGIELLVGNLDFGFRLLLGIICSLVIALAGILLFFLRLSGTSTLQLIVLFCIFYRDILLSEEIERRNRRN